MTEPPLRTTIVLPPFGSVDLDWFAASDLDVVNAARVSLSQYSEYMTTPDEKLINYLMRNKHGSPFEHNFFKWHVKAPIFVFREWHRHRIGWSYNEQSARYSELRADFYIPDRLREQTGKPGNYDYKDIVVDDGSEAGYSCKKEILNSYSRSYYEYDALLKAGVAREQARMVLPVGIYSQMIASCNARSLMNFLSLRNHETAQWEIRQYAIAMEEKFAEAMPVTHRAFVKHGRVAP